MSKPDLYAVTETTWPSASVERCGPWTIRDGAGGGKRVCAATADGAWGVDDIDAAEAAMTALDQDKLFMLRVGEDELDQALDAHGYRVIDPVWIYSVPVRKLTTEILPHATAMTVWPPLAIQTELWAEGGIGPARLDVMNRCDCPKTSILGRAKDQPAGSAFVACDGDTAMIHAIEVTSALRRLGVARNILRAAAHWAQVQGAQDLTLLVTKANEGANALYASLGFDIVGQYHYRIKKG